MNREYRTIEKSTWGAGPWMDEPDKVQWVDAATGLDCLAVRNHGGALCGYVGLPESHPWHGIGYSGCTLKPPCGESYCDHSPNVDVHGGLTFADSCYEPSRENWEKWRARLTAPATLAEAAKYPKGDTARAQHEQRHMVDDYEAFRAWGESKFICQIPLAGRPAKVWWFGFDCAHSGDHSPASAAFFCERGLGRDGEQYRTLDYVKSECASLARQLASVRAPVPDGA